ncbi:MAG: XRE family transcriptional regulator [Puniceicoccaceae bacterium]|nr:MAG: XRE family transcriptional regulator [Puniceicoccaceae bacterium]
MSKKSPSVENAFGEVLRIRRKELGLSQESLSAQTGISLNFISLCERGLRQPSLNTIFLLSRGLNLSPSQIVIQVESLRPTPKT